MTRIRALSELLERPVRRQTALEPMLSASASPLDFHHPDPALTALRRRVPLRGGDYTLTVWVQPRDRDRDFLDVVASSVLDQSHVPGERVTEAHIDRLWGLDVMQDGYPSRWMSDIHMPSPAHVLWQNTKFGVLEWNTAQLPWLHEAISRVATGGSVGRRPPTQGTHIWVESTPELTEDDARAMLTVARDRLAEWARRYSPPPARVELLRRAIAADCRQLGRLCSAHGSFARLVFPSLRDPCARAEQMLVANNDGNTRDVYLETSDAWVTILFETS